MRQSILKETLHKHSHKLFWSIPVIVLFGLGMLSSTAFVQEDKTILAIYPEGGTFLNGQNFEVNVHVVTPKSINAIAAQVAFPADKFQVVRVSQGDSILKLWIIDPQASNEEGVVRFAGGLPNPGFRGDGNVITILFHARGTGWGSVGFSGASVLANDGKGTNVLEGTRAGAFFIQEPPEKFPDLNDDNRVDLSDLAILISHWRENYDSRYDINNDGQIGLRDAAILISSLGRTRP